MIKYPVSTSLDVETRDQKETIPDTQHSTGFTGGALNKLENGVQCKQNGRLCQRSPCIFLFELSSIFYYFSSLPLEFWQQFKNMHSWDPNVVSSDPSHTVNHFFSWNVSSWDEAIQTFSKGEKSSPVSPSQIPLTNVQQKQFQDSTPHKNAAPKPLSPLIFLNFSRQEMAVFIPGWG